MIVTGKMTIEQWLDSDTVAYIGVCIKISGLDEEDNNIAL